MPGRQPIAGLDDGKRAGEDLVAREALHKRHTGDLDERVADAEDRERGDRGGHGRQRAERDERDPDQHAAEREPAGQAPPPQHGERNGAAEHAAHAPARVQPADAGAADRDELHGHDHHEYVDQALDERREGQDADDQPQRGLARHRARALGQLAQGLGVLRGAVLRHDVLRDGSERRRSKDEGRAGGDEGGLDAGRRDERSADERAPDEGRVVGRAPQGIGGGELLGGASQMREQRRLRGLVGRLEGGEDRRECERDGERRLHGHGRRDGREHERASRAGDDEDVPARVAVADQAREGRGERRREHARERRQADGRRAPFGVGVDRQRDHEGPAADRSRQPRECEPPQSTRRKRGTEACSDAAHGLPSACVEAIAAARHSCPSPFAPSLCVGAREQRTGQVLG
jgi:hypothetical protein